MNLEHLSDNELHKNLKHKVETERMSTTEVLQHLCEVKRRMLYAKMKYSSLKEYCVKELNTSNTYERETQSATAAEAQCAATTTESQTSALSRYCTCDN